MQIEDGNKELLQLQQRRIELEYENQQLKTQLFRLGRDLVFNIHKEEAKVENSDGGCWKDQIKYTLTHSSTQVLERQAEIKFLDQPKRLTLQVQSSCQEKENHKEFYLFSYSILQNDELEDNPKIMATDSKIEIIFDKNQKNNSQLIQLKQ
ncbi:unnamed protein product (macronuclear) [Paramecium tetraurelia]|uniref:Uncharacterized protein n=1 Tax=Paramecium tetraurelia TaxID=5888 RepID=A0CX54_PARTE|nr:uncharacterized protein GSPATT00001575001 [Paramecium tetraurelia]CAK75371.1 unnamed protein product [Paramecium tetraurelia]|eukprot:XP_001442768.1 hypothetical protein (macronuclear) [Paramecium tetraurelia strain d4-2]